MPVTHFSLGSSDIASLSKFYDAALAPLGYTLKANFENGKVLGYSDGQEPSGPSFWIADDSVRPAHVQAQLAAGAKHVPVHFALGSPTREAVDAFYKAALAAGGRCNGPPGVRPHAGPAYYAAFVLDPEGKNVEAACIQVPLGQDV